MKKNKTKNKIKDFEDLVKTVKKLRKQGKRIILSHGVFDLLHPGHIKHFEKAKSMADVLIVTITRDEYVNKGPGRPVFNHRLRAESVASLECVDYVAVNKWPIAVETILQIKPDIYVKGRDYKERADDITGKIYDEEKAVISGGGRIEFTDEMTFSSSHLLNRHFSVYSKEAENFLRKFKKKYSSDEIVNKLKGLNGVKVLVIGDIIIDEYHYCVGIGKPSKADIVSTKYLKKERFTGGVLAVAKHVSGFCEKVDVVSVLGKKNNYESFVKNNLGDNIKAKFFFREDVPTVVKKRYLNPSFLNKTFEINYIDDNETPPKLTKKICDYLKKTIRKYDMVIAADFGHGFINSSIVDVLCAKSRFLCVNTQANSANMGYNLITKYPRADYLCIDEPEIRLALHDKFGKIKDLMLYLSKKLKCSKLVITRGHEGALVYEKRKGFSKIPVFSKEIVDRIGAGDAFLSVTSPMVYKKHSMELVGFIGNAVGALAVLIVGNKSSIKPVPLYKFIETLLK